MREPWGCGACAQGSALKSVWSCGPEMAVRVFPSRRRPKPRRHRVFPQPSGALRRNGTAFVYTGGNTDRQFRRQSGSPRLRELLATARKSKPAIHAWCSIPPNPAGFPPEEGRSPTIKADADAQRLAPISPAPALGAAGAAGWSARRGTCRRRGAGWRRSGGRCRS